MIKDRDYMTEDMIYNPEKYNLTESEKAKIRFVAHSKEIRAIYIPEANKEAARKIRKQRKHNSK